MMDMELIRVIAELEGAHGALVSAALRDDTPEALAAVDASAASIKALYLQLKAMRGPAPDISGFAGRWGGNVVGQADGRRSSVDMHEFMGVRGR